jgi:urease accessory protein
MGTDMVDEYLKIADLLRLQAWLSPAFPIGGFSYSHGLEEAVAVGDVDDLESLFIWIEAAVNQGAGRVDGMLLVAAWRAEDAGDHGRLQEVAEIGEAMRGTAELALESKAQGEAFLDTVQAAWPNGAVEAATAAIKQPKINRGVPVAVAVGMVTACHGVPVEYVLPLYLQSFASGIVSAGVRLIPLGQTDGQRLVARMHPIVERAGGATLEAKFEDIGGATPMIDLASMAHEMRDGRLFRS